MSFQVLSPHHIDSAASIDENAVGIISNIVEYLFYMYIHSCIYVLIIVLFAFIWLFACAFLRMMLFWCIFLYLKYDH